MKTQLININPVSSAARLQRDYGYVIEEGDNIWISQFDYDDVEINMVISDDPDYKNPVLFVDIVRDGETIDTLVAELHKRTSKSNGDILEDIVMMSYSSYQDLMKKIKNMSDVIYEG